MTDINTLDLKQPDPIDAAQYADGGGKVIPIPPKGTYNLRINDVEWGGTKDGYLQATLTETVVDPGKPWDGHEVRYDRVNTKRWPNRERSSIGDLIRACGVPQLPTGNDGYIQVVNALKGRTYEAGLDWEVYKSGGPQLKGMEAFPEGPGGTKQDFIYDADGTTKLYARARVVFRVSKVPSAVKA